MKSRLAALALLPLLLTGCESPEFGADIKEFVEKEVYGVSVVATTGRLQSGWNTTMQQGFQTAIARNELLIQEADKIKLPKLEKNMSLEAALGILAEADRGLVTLVGLQQDATETARRLDRLTKSCDSRETFDDLKLGDIAESLMSQLSKPERAEPGVSGNSNPYVMAGDAAGDFISRERYNEQVRLTNEAVAKIPATVIQPAAAFEISKRECRRMLDVYFLDISRVQRAVGSLSDGVREKTKALLAIRRVAERKIVSANLEEASRASGYAKLVAEIRSNNFAGNLEIGLVQAAEELRSLRKGINQSRGCVDRLKAMETYQDALIENRAVLKHLSAQAGEDSLGQRIRLLSEKVNAADAEFKGKLPSLRNEVCR